MSKHMVTVQSNNTLDSIVGPEVACAWSLVDDKPNSNIVDTASPNSSEKPLEETKHDETAKSYWRNNIKIHEENMKYRETFL